MSAGPKKTIHDEGYQVLLEALKAERLKAGLTQTDLARRLGTEQSHVSKYERAERRLDVMELRAVCKAIGINVSTFLARFEDTLNRKGLS